VRPEEKKEKEERRFRSEEGNDIRRLKPEGGKSNFVTRLGPSPKREEGGSTRLDVPKKDAASFSGGEKCVASLLLHRQRRERPSFSREEGCLTQED